MKYPGDELDQLDQQEIDKIWKQITMYKTVIATYIEATERYLKRVEELKEKLIKI